MSMPLSLQIPDQLVQRIRAVAEGDVSAWVIGAIEDRLDRDMWAMSKQADEMLGIDEPWLAEEQLAMVRTQSPAG
ncbi:hypothetical protein ACWIGI_25000 [Nocardia sp. NPDC055321]